MRVLILGCAEICFNPRLIKAADCFLREGWPVTVYSPYFGNLSRSRYQEFVQRRNWKVITFDLSRQTLASSLRWFVASVVHGFCSWLWGKGSQVGFCWALNKSTVGMRVDPREFDLVYLNLVDNLPLVTAMKRRNSKLRVIYDCQEYFEGQYSTEPPQRLRWVRQAQRQGIDSVDYVLATTNVMKERLQKELPFAPERTYRVRNVPAEFPQIHVRSQDLADPLRPLRLIWHGFRIYYRNRRGLYLIVEALAAASCRVEFYVQGIPVEAEVAELRREAERLGISERIHVVDPADPDRIVESLAGYDIGVAGEIPEEENQRLTSSNKLFEFIAAGLATLMPDLPGLRETVAEYDTGLLFEPGNVAQLAQAIDRLHTDRDLLKRFQQNSNRAAATELSWARDFAPVLRHIRG